MLYRDTFYIDGVQVHNRKSIVFIVKNIAGLKALKVLGISIARLEIKAFICIFIRCSKHNLQELLKFLNC